MNIMGRTVDFDVNLIGKISFRPSYKTDRYKWREEKMTPNYKRFLLFFKVRSGNKFEPAGFYYERTSYYGEDFFEYVTEEYVMESGYMIKHAPYPYDGKEAWIRATVEVSLGYKLCVNESFDTDDEAKDWIKKLKYMSNKSFETVEYGN